MHKNCISQNGNFKYCYKIFFFVIDDKFLIENVSKGNERETTRPCHNDVLWRFKECLISIENLRMKYL